MSGREVGLLLLTRSGSYVAVLQSMTIWISAWMYLRRVADQVLCKAELDRYHSHLVLLRGLVHDYPCAQLDLRHGGAFSGLAYFVMRPLIALRCHVLIALNGVEELAGFLVFLLNAVLCLGAVLVPSARVRGLMRRVFLVAPIFIHHLLSTLPLLVPGQRGIPSLLAQHVPLRPIYVLYLALTGARFCEVVAAVLVTLGSTVITTVLLLQAGVPLHYRPFGVFVHITSASLVALAWSAMWDDRLPVVMLVHCQRQPRRTAPISGLPGRADQCDLSGGRAGTFGVIGAGLADAPPPTKTGARSTVPRAAPTKTAADVVTVARVMDTGAKWWREGSATPWSRRMMAPKVAKIEVSGVRKRRPLIAAIALEPLGLQTQVDAAGDDIANSGADSIHAERGHAFPSTTSTAATDLHAGCANDLICRALSAASLLRTRIAVSPMEIGCAMPAIKALSACGFLAASWCRKDGEHRFGVSYPHGPDGAGALTAVSPAPCAALRSGGARRRFASQVRREVLRIRIVGADPEQLPPDWRELVFEHFSGRSRVPGADGSSLASYLASGVAVRRGSIFLTVSLVQLPSQHDGGEGPGGAGDRPGSRNHAAAATTVAPDPGRAQPPAGEPSAADARAAATPAANPGAGPRLAAHGPVHAAGAGTAPKDSEGGASAALNLGPVHGGQGLGSREAGDPAAAVSTAAAAAAAVASSEVQAALRGTRSQQQQHLHPDQQAGSQLRSLIRTASAGVGRQGAAAAAAATSLSGVDGPSNSNCARNYTAGGVATGTATGIAAPIGDSRRLSGSGRAYLAPQLQPGATSADTGAGADTAGNGSQGLHGYYGTSLAGYPPGRRRIAGVWRADRRISLRSSSSTLSTSGNSNNPLHLLGPTAASSVCSGSPYVAGPPAGPTGGLSSGLVHVMVSPPPPPVAGQGPGQGLGAGPGGLQQPMRYTPLLSPLQQVPICAGLGAYAVPVTGALAAASAGLGSRPGSTEITPPQHYHPQYQLPPQHMHRGGAAGPGPTHGSAARIGGGSTGVTTTTSMQVAQLLDAMQLRSRESTSRENRQGYALSVLSAVSQLDGGIPVHLRQVLGPRSWEPDEPCASSSWEAEGLYERPLPPPLMPSPQHRVQHPQQGQAHGLQHQQHAHAQVRRWVEDLAAAAASGLFVLSEAPSPPPLPASGMAAAGLGAVMVQQRAAAQRAQAAGALPGRAMAGDARAGQRGFASRVPMSTTYHGAALGGGLPGLAQTVPMPAGGGMWPPQPHAAGLAVLADPASLPVRDVAVKPVLICKAPLMCAAAAGDLATSIPAPSDMAVAAAGADVMDGDSGPDVGGALAAGATAGAPPQSGVAGSSEMELSLMCAPATVSELSVMLRYCGPASVFGEQTYLPVQLQLDSASPAVAAAIRLQAAASERDRRGGSDTQATRDVAEASTDPLPAHATVRTVLSGLACPGVLYVELWHGPQLCACLPVLLLPESAAGWAHEVCSLWQQQAEEGEAAAAVAGVSRAGAAAVSAAAHQVVEDLGGWLTYAAHKRYVAERALAAAATAAAAAAAVASSSVALSSLGIFRAPQFTQGPGGVPTGQTAASAVASTTATISPPQMGDDWYSGWLGELIFTDASTASPFAPSPPVTAGFPMAVPAASAPLSTGATGRIDATQPQLQPHPQARPPSMPSAQMVAGAAGPSMPLAMAAAYDGTGGASNREVLHDIMLQEGYNWLADCVEAGCCGLAAALMDSLLAAGCTAGEVLRTCRSADGLPLIHAAVLSCSPAMMELVWGWGQAAGMDKMGWQPPPGIAMAVAAATAPPEATGAAPYADAGGALGGEAGGDSTESDTRTGLEAVARSAGLPQPLHLQSSANMPDSAPRGGSFTEAEALASVVPSARADNTLAGTGQWLGGWAVKHVVELLPGKRCRDAAQGLARAVNSLVAALKDGYVAMAQRGARSHMGGRLADACGAEVDGPTERGALRDGTSGASAARPVLEGEGRGRCSAGSDGPTAALRDGVYVGGAGDVNAATGGGIGWQHRRRCMPLRELIAAALRVGDAAVTALHALVLRVNVLHVDGGAEERRFLSHFQQQHGWVFSAWCWSMIPLYALIVWRCMQERQWAELALTPLWMWMYVVCAALDLAGATRAYRTRTEAIAAAMHLSHSLSKALHCAGLPSYPVPAGRLYWLDVLACATLSALCEPVRLCVACPLRLINFAVSTLLYRTTGTAPSFLEAMLLSASCHCFGLLMQHAVESHYRHTFAAAQAASAAAGAAATTMDSAVSAAAAAATAAATTATKAQAFIDGLGGGGGDDNESGSGSRDGAGPSSGQLQSEQEQYAGAPPLPPPTLPPSEPSSNPESFTTLSPSSLCSAPPLPCLAYALDPEEEAWSGSDPACVTLEGIAAAAAAPAAETPTTAAAATIAVSGADSAPWARVAAADTARLDVEAAFMAFPQLQGREERRLRDRDRGDRDNGGANSSPGVAVVSTGSLNCLGVGGRQSGGLDSAVVDPREEFLLPDGQWEFPDAPAAWPSAWQYDCGPAHAARQTRPSLSGWQPRSGLPAPPPLPTSVPPPRPQLDFELPSQQPPQPPRHQQHGQAQAPAQTCEKQTQQKAPRIEAAGVRRWEGGEVQGSGALSSAEAATAWEETGRDGGCLRLSGLLQLPLPGSVGHANGPSDAVASGLVSGGSAGGRSSSGSAPVRPRDSGSGHSSFVSRRGHGAGSGGSGVASENVHGSSRQGDSTGGSDGSSGGRGSGGNRGSGRGTGAISSSNRLSSGSSSRVSGGSLRQLVSRATGWVAGTLRRRSPRQAGISGRKAGVVS